jgi:hypothetical protein
VGTIGTVGGCRDYDVAYAILIDVANVSRYPAELIVRRLSSPFAHNANRFDQRVLKFLGLWQQGGVARITAQLLSLLVL